MPGELVTLGPHAGQVCLVLVILLGVHVGMTPHRIARLAVGVDILALVVP